MKISHGHFAGSFEDEALPGGRTQHLHEVGYLRLFESIVFRK